MVVEVVVVVVIDEDDCGGDEFGNGSSGEGGCGDAGSGVWWLWYRCREMPVGRVKGCVVVTVAASGPVTLEGN